MASSESIFNRNMRQISSDLRLGNVAGSSPIEVPAIIRRELITLPEKSTKFVAFALQYDLDAQVFAPCEPPNQPVKSLFFQYFLGGSFDTSSDSIFERFLVVKFHLPVQVDLGERPKSHAVESKVEQILRRGIRFLSDGAVFHLIGSSNSGVQARSFFFCRVHRREECQTLLKWFIPNLEELEREKGVAKRVKYVGLLFSGCAAIVSLPMDTIVAMDLIDNKFTDGCGVISLGLAEVLRDQIPELRELPDPPSIWQIRYLGHGSLCKGVLVVDASNKNYYIGLRKSMMKVPVAAASRSVVSGSVAAELLQLKIGVCSWSRFSIGRLNKQVVALLSAFMPSEILLAIQNTALEAAKWAAEHPLSAAMCCATFGEKEFGAFKQLVKRRVLKKHPPANYRRLLSLAGQLAGSTEATQLGKLAIPLAQSRQLVGASFPEKLKESLREGECVVLTEKAPYEGLVLVSRSPSYSPGDLRVLKAVLPPKDSPIWKLRNCILFCTVGARADPDKMSGGDLDGDLYLVIWDARILNCCADKMLKEPPTDYDAPKRREVRQDEDWLRYMARWDNMLLSRIDKCFFRLARAEGVRSSACVKLCEIFSRAVDQHACDLHALADLEAQARRTCDEFDMKKAMVALGDSDTSDQELEEQLPIWDRMLRKQLIASAMVRKAADDPKKCRELWSIFYKNLFAYELLKPENKIRDAFRGPSALAFTCNISAVDIRRCEKSWEKLVKETTYAEDSWVRPGGSWWESSWSQSFTWGGCGNLNDRSWSNGYWGDSDSCSASTASKSAIGSEVVNKFAEELKSRAQKSFQPEITKYEFEIAGAEQQVERQNRILEFRQREIGMAQSTAQMSLREIDQAIRKVQSELQQKIERSGNIVFKLSLEYERTQKHLLRLKGRKFDSMPDCLRSCFRRFEEMFPPVSEWLLQGLFPGVRDATIDITNASVTVLDLLEQRASVEAQKRREEYDFAWKVAELERTMRKSELLGELRSLKQESKDLLSGHLFALAKQKVAFQETKTKDVEYQLETARSSELQAIKKVQQRKQELERHTEMCCSQDYSKPRLQELQTELGQLHRARSSVGNSVYTATRTKIEADIRKINEMLEQTTNLQATLRTLTKEKEAAEWAAREQEGNLETQRLKLQSLQQVLEDTHSPDKLEAAKQAWENALGKLQGCELALVCVERNCDMAIRDFRIRPQFEQKPFVNTSWSAWIRRKEQLQLVLQREERRLSATDPDKRLPVYAKRAEVVQALSQHDAVVITAGTGCGKSTQFPQYLVDDLSLNEDKIYSSVVCTQPRRLAATKIAERVAQEYGSHPSLAEKELQQGLLDLGGWVGFHVGSRGAAALGKNNLNKQSSKSTRLLFVTEGLLVHQLRGAKSACDVPFECVIIDEAHQRGRDTDLLMAQMRRILLESKRRRDELKLQHRITCPTAVESSSGGTSSDTKLEKPLKVVVMSASINASRFCRYFLGCPTIDCPEKLYPVKECWPETLSPEPFDFDLEEHAEIDEEKLVNRALVVFFDQIASGNELGDVLIFLPGKLEIHACVDQINERAHNEDKDIAAYPLYADLKGKLQDEAIDEKIRGGDSKNRKVVCCTNIAETSLTIPGVRFVIESGKAKKLTYDHQLRLNVLRVADISRAAAKQRKGRAGRMDSGFFYPLYSKEYHDKKMEAYEEPEMKQTPVEGLILHSLANFGESIEHMELMDPPDPEAVFCGRERLINLGFIEENSGSNKSRISITADGKYANALSSHIDLESARMLLLAEDLGCTEEVIRLAALLAEKNGDLFQQDRSKKTVAAAGSRGSGGDPRSDGNFTNDMKGSGEEKSKSAPEMVSHEDESRWKFVDDLGDHFSALLALRGYEAERERFKKAETQVASFEHNGNKSTKKLNGRSSSTTSSSKNSNHQAFKCSEHLKAWCAKHRLCYSTLKSAEETQEKVYEVLKRTKRLGKVVPENMTPELLKMNLCRCLVAGYFHNLAIPHNMKSIRSGFSMATPMKKEVVGDRCSSTQETETHLLKLHLSSWSALTLHGDVEKNTLVIFGAISKTKSGKCFMNMVSRVDESFVLEHASERWRKKIGFEAGGLNLVMSHEIRHLGPQVMCAALLCGNGGDKPITQIENETNCCIDIDVEGSNILLYGSHSEIRKAAKLVETEVKRKRSEIVQQSLPEVYPKHALKETQCRIQNGVRVEANSFVGDLCAQRLPTWDSVESGSIIFINAGEGMLEYIQQTLVKLLDELSLPVDTLSQRLQERGSTYIANFSSIDAANEIFCKYFEGFDVLYHRFGLPRGAFAKLDESVKILTAGGETTELYPSVEFIAKKEFPGVRVHVTRYCFRVTKQDRKSRSNPIAPFLKALVDREILKTEMLEGWEIASYLGVDRQFAAKMLQKWKKEYGPSKGANMFIMDRGASVAVEISGERPPRNEAMQFLRKKLDEFQRDGFQEIVKLQAGELCVVLKRIEQWRRQFEFTRFDLQKPFVHGSSNVPTLVIRSVTRHNCKESLEAVQKDLTAAARAGLQLALERLEKCCECGQKVFVERRGKRPHIDSSAEGSGSTTTDLEVYQTRPLTLCGCVWCSVCFGEMVKKQLERQHRQHDGGGSTSYRGTYAPRDVICEMCNTGPILTWDLHILLSRDKDEVFRLACRNYFEELTQKNGRVVVECPQCGTFALRDDTSQEVGPTRKGICRCRNSQCYRIYCAGCDKCVRNQIEFETHTGC